MEDVNIDDLKKKIEELEKQRDEYLDGWKRAKADLINYKKEENERFGNLAKFSNEILMRELIIILDSFNLASASFKESSAEKKGLELIKIQLEDILKKYGLEKISVSPGDTFDPTKHEAIAEVESEKPEGTVAEEIEKGYAIGGKVIRAVRVMVAKDKNNKQQITNDLQQAKNSKENK